MTVPRYVKQVVLCRLQIGVSLKRVLYLLVLVKSAELKVPISFQCLQSVLECVDGQCLYNF